MAKLGGVPGCKSEGKAALEAVPFGLQRGMDFAAGIRFAHEGHELVVIEGPAGVGDANEHKMTVYFLKFNMRCRI